MRHLMGLLLALVASAALFFGGGWGIAKFGAVDSGRGMRSAAAWASLHTALPLAALIGTGLLVGILLAVRQISALATGLPGLALIGWSALVLLRGNQALTYIPMSGSHYAAGFSSMLSTGTLLFLGAAMIIPMFIPSRWRRATAEVEDYPADEYATQAALGLVP
jgi:hypothetical protein